jgi:hypothetical protein
LLAARNSSSTTTITLSKTSKASTASSMAFTMAFLCYYQSLLRNKAINLSRLV